MVYFSHAQDYAGIISHVINGDTVSEFTETGEKNEYYKNTGGDAPQFDDITMLAFRYNGK